MAFPLLWLLLRFLFVFDFSDWLLEMPGFVFLFLVLLRFGGASLNLWLKFFWKCWEILGPYLLPIKSLVPFSFFSSNIFKDIWSSVFHVFLTHFSVLSLSFHSFSASVWILCLVLSSRLLLLSFTVSSALTPNYWILKFDLSYVRISLVKFSISTSTFPNILIFF